MLLPNSSFQTSASSKYSVALLLVVFICYDSIDGAHAGWLGWPDNLGPTATVMTEILDAAKAINPAAKVRGVATNVR